MNTLSHNQEVLLTRQRHEADRAGLHYDIRMVVGDVAHSWATKKEMPKLGETIILWEQPIHDRGYALSKKVVIPKGQYGAGTTYLDTVKKAIVSNPENSSDKFTLNVPSTKERYLVRKVPSYGDTAWIFKHLPYKDLELKDSANKYLEKASSLILGAIGTHLAQNIATKAALKSKHISKYLSNSFSEGAHGVVNTSLRSRATRFLTGAAVPDIAVAHKTFHEFGGLLKTTIDKATNRQKVGLRMLSEGRISDLKKYNLHKDPVVLSAHKIATNKFPSIPSMDVIVNKAKNISSIFKDKSHPLASNILKNLSHGHTPTGTNFKPGVLTSKPSIAGAASSALVDPSGGALNLIKTISSSKKFGETKIGSKINKVIQKQFITKPITLGISSKVPDTFKAKLKHKVSEIAVNPVSAQLKRTSAAISEGIS